MKELNVSLVTENITDEQLDKLDEFINKVKKIQKRDNEQQQQYIRNLEKGYIDILQVFNTHACDDISSLFKIYEIIKPIIKWIQEDNQ